MVLDLPPDLVIFDCDGVLVDSEPIVAGVVAERLRLLDVDISDEECAREFLGLDQDAAARLIVDRLGDDVPFGWFDSLTVAVDSALRDRVRPVPGVVDVLSRMSVPFCVASNGRPEKVALTLEASGLAAYFDDRVFTAANVAFGKPAPDLFLLAAIRLGARPTRCVVVEDSGPGVVAARAAGMRVLGFAPIAGQSLAGVDQTFARMAELPGLLGIAS